MMRAALRWSLVAMLAALGVARADEAPLPVEAFFRNAEIGGVKLSPSGQWLAMTTSTKASRVFLAVVNVDGSSMTPKVLANFTDADVRSFEWVNDDRLVFNTIDTTSPLRDQQFGPGLFSIARTGGTMRTLIAPTWYGGSMVGRALTPNHALLAIGGGPDMVIVGRFKQTNRRELDSVVPLRLNVATGETVPYDVVAPPRATGWVFDAKGTPRAAVASASGRIEVFWRNDGPWKSIGEFPDLKVDFVPVAVDDQDRLEVTAQGPDGYEVLKRFDFGSGKPEAAALVSARGFDLHPALIEEPDTGRLVGVRFETDATTTVWFDPALKRLQKLVDDRFPDAVNTLSCRRCEAKGTFVVFSHSDRDPGTYYLYRDADQSWETIGRARAAIDPATMARLDFFRIKARDGEDLPVWVTTPRAKSAGPRPAVVLVHGGPWVRGGHWQWDPEAQFLASRGYVVIEPEFRGSTGYGLAHMTKGFKQWGLAMQDDLLDAVQWAAAKGTIDPGRVCIAGASYGGYATFMGLVRHPDAYRCGVAWVGVSDPRLMFDNAWQTDVPQEAQRYALRDLIGDPDTDAALLKDASALEHAAAIKAPVLMAYGANDVRVPLNHGTLMRDALRDAGRKPEFVVYTGEGHGFLKVENRVDFWTRVEKFLAQNLH